MRKLTPEEREKLQAMLDKESVGQAERDLKLLKHNMVIQRKLPRLHATATGGSPPIQKRTSKRQELIDEGQKRKKLTVRGPRLKQMKLTEQEKKELAAKIRGTE